MEEGDLKGIEENMEKQRKKYKEVLGHVKQRREKKMKEEGRECK